jgi:glycosyltransferase involved in cell wall biosynthesis
MTQFSIIIATYNQEHFIRDAVDSALSQPCASKEVIVVDDASTDGTVKVLEQYGDKIRLLKMQTNQGANRARNAGASMAKGDYFIFLDGDDLLLPWALNVYAHIVELRKPKVILCRLLFFKGALPAAKYDDFDQGLQVVEYDALIRKDRSYRGSASAIVVERRVFEDVGGWTNEIWPSEIDDLTMKLGYSGRTIHILSHPTTAYRMHANNTMHQVYRFVDTMHMVIRKEKQGKYLGGPRFQYERYAYIGGAVFFWFKKALGAGLYWPAVKFLASGWLMILAKIASTLRVVIKGRRPVGAYRFLTVLCPHKERFADIAAAKWQTSGGRWTSWAVVDCPLLPAGQVRCDMSCLSVGSLSE